MMIDKEACENYNFNAEKHCHASSARSTRRWGREMLLSVGVRAHSDKLYRGTEPYYSGFM